ncbi:iron export ABC transporter permease subunit FetB [Bacillus solimangrovi]|uniref:Iron export ABC transporter permease subunit FetB n=1 Tax=Bacillus solimangrovi TaxID=1305675 RepID=A0A1E5LFS4_9BACI|nr:iron export ABC transporter permease subunit FetB [Bacillus solimangrovi]
MSNTSMLFLMTFVFIPMLLSYLYALKVEKDVLWASLRGSVQLFAIGYVLTYLFSLPPLFGITFMLIVMISVAGINASRRGKSLPYVRVKTFLTLIVIEVFVLSLWLIFNMISFKAEEVIPMSGMVIGNCMVAIGLALNRMKDEFSESKGRILAALSLGVSAKEASKLIIRKTLRAAMIPNIDGLKTIGLVQLPGMMTGLILGGVSPIDAIRYQLVISLSIFSAVSLSAMMITALMYKSFFNENIQLLDFEE